MSNLGKKLFGIIHRYRNVLMDMYCEVEDLETIESEKSESEGGLIDECHEYLNNKIKEGFKQ